MHPTAWTMETGPLAAQDYNMLASIAPCIASLLQPARGISQRLEEECPPPHPSWLPPPPTSPFLKQRYLLDELLLNKPGPDPVSKKHRRKGSGDLPIMDPFCWNAQLLLSCSLGLKEDFWCLTRPPTPRYIS